MPWTQIIKLGYTIKLHRIVFTPVCLKGCFNLKRFILFWLLISLVGQILVTPAVTGFLKPFPGCTVVEAVEGATLHPAQVLGIEQRKGTLDFDTDADMVLLDDRLCVQATFIAGEPVWIRTYSPVEAELLNKYHLSHDNFKFA